MSVHSASACEQGPFRPNNEDRVIERTAAGLFAVIDGVGGHDDGDLAADIAQAVLTERCVGSPSRPTLIAAFAEANRRIVAEAEARGSAEGMACVATVAWLNRETREVIIGHVGDTRAYLFAPDGSGAMITRDHGVVGTELPEAAAMVADDRNVVTKVIGLEPVDDAERWVDVYERRVEPAELLVLATDGLSDYVSRGGLSALVEAHAEWPRELVDAIVVSAIAGQHERERGDNIGVVVVRIWGPPQRPAVAPPSTVWPKATISPVAAPSWRSHRAAAVGAAVFAAVLGALFLFLGNRPVPVTSPTLAEIAEDACADVSRWLTGACRDRPMVAAGDGPVQLGGAWGSTAIAGAGRWRVIGSDPVEIAPQAVVTWSKFDLHGSELSVLRVGRGARLILDRVQWHAPSATQRWVLEEGAVVELRGGRFDLGTLRTELSADAMLIVDGAQLRVAEGEPVFGAPAPGARIRLDRASLELGTAPLFDDSIAPEDLGEILALGDESVRTTVLRVAQTKAGGPRWNRLGPLELAALRGFGIEIDAQRNEEL